MPDSKRYTRYTRTHAVQCRNYDAIVYFGGFLLSFSLLRFCLRLVSRSLSSLLCWTGIRAYTIVVLVGRVWQPFKCIAYSLYECNYTTSYFLYTSTCNFVFKCVSLSLTHTRPMNKAERNSKMLKFGNVVPADRSASQHQNGTTHWPYYTFIRDAHTATNIMCFGHIISVSNLLSEWMCVCE